MKSLRSRILLVSALTLLSIYGLIPTIIYLSQPSDLRNDHEYMKNKVPRWLPQARLNLGLDLQGGVQLVLGVDLEQAVENRLGRISTEATHWAEDKKMPLVKAFLLKGKSQLRVELKEGANVEDFRAAFAKEFTGLQVVTREPNALVFSFKDDQIASIKASALEQAERVVRTRVDKWGVTEPIINRRADKSILAQLPGFKDPEKAKELLGRTAQLKFKIVDDEFRGLDEIAQKLPPTITAERSGGSVSLISEDRDAILKLVEGKIPPDREIIFQRELLQGGKKSRFHSYIVRSTAELTGEDIFNASVTQDSSNLDNSPAVALQFTSSGSRRFAEVTGNNVRKRMAIILDELVESAPVINEKIAGGNAIIKMGSGRGYNEMIEEANQLILVLKSGALPATITILEQRQVGSTLGPELAQRGVWGTAVGLLLVFAFMLIYYRRPGMIACVALVLNGIYLVAMMAAFGFALTLPGIAGFVLSLGMAVDANVLINERIRQELREGKNARKALDLGFQKVFWTVFDSHVTTLLAASILLGTNTSGPIRGFAVTLIIGLIVSLYTSLYCSHLFFDIMLARSSSDQGVKKWLGGDSASKDRRFNLNFLRFDALNTTLAFSLALAVIVAAAVKGFNWSVDFVGGTEVELAFKQDIKPEAIRAVAHKAGVEDLIVQALKGGEKEYLLRFEEVSGKGSSDRGSEDHAAASAGSKVQRLQELVKSDLAASGPEIRRIDYVGPQVGRELRNDGFASMIWAILGILVYLGFRFDLRFGSGAVLKLIPDACAMLAFYLVFWRSFDLTSVAALLTGIGYSVSDIIVVYDRIRENLHLHPKRPMRENVNISLNETLTRTINTSVVTNLSLVGIIVYGPESIRNFAIAMSVGIVTATLTSNFVGSSYLLWIDKIWRNRSTKMSAASANRNRQVASRSET